MLQSQRPDVSCSWPSGSHTSQEGFCPLLFADPLQVIKVSKLTTCSSLHRFSLGFRSGNWLGHSRTLMCFLLSHSFVALAMCFGSLSCWKTHPRPVFNALAGSNALALTVHGPVHLPFDAVQFSRPLTRKTLPNNVSTSMFDGGDGVLGVIHCSISVTSRVCYQLFSW